MNTVVKLQVESEAAAKVFLPEAMPRWLVERYHSPEVRGKRNRGRTRAEERQSSSVHVVVHPWPGSCYGVPGIWLRARGKLADLRMLLCFPPQVARVPELHLIDAVLSPEENNLLTKDGLDSCALR